MRQRISPIWLLVAVPLAIALGVMSLVASSRRQDEDVASSTEASTWPDYVAGAGVEYESAEGGYRVVLPLAPTLRDTESDDGYGTINSAMSSVDFGEFVEILHRDMGPGFMGESPETSYAELPPYASLVYKQVDGELLSDESGWLSDEVPYYDFTFRFDQRGTELVSSNRAVTSGQHVYFLTVISTDEQPEAFERLVDSSALTE